MNTNRRLTPSLSGQPARRGALIGAVSAMAVAGVANAGVAAAAAPTSSSAAGQRVGSSALSTASGSAPNRFQTGFPTIKAGSAWQDVRALQYLLFDQGAGRTDWSTSYNSTTVQAVKRYQAKRHLPQTGIADPTTLSYLAVSTSSGQNAYRTFGVETLLKKHGYVFDTASAPKMTTHYDANINTFVRAFQAGHGIGQAALVGPTTWRTLFGPRTSGPIYPLMQYQTGQAQWTNCGPAAAVAIELYKGKTPAKWYHNAASRSDAINYFRYNLAGVPNTTYYNTKVGTTGANLVPAFGKAGLPAHTGGVGDVIAAARKGIPSIEGGDAYKLTWNRYQGSFVHGPASHFIAVLGWDGTYFIIVDPIANPSSNYVHLLTESQLRAFAATAPGWGPNVPGNNVPPSRNSIILNS